MGIARTTSLQEYAKASTGIAGFDAITGGGLPRARTTLLIGGPGAGKTLFALQFLAHGVRDRKEAGIFVAFEETARRIVANAASFGWKLAQTPGRKLYFMDAQPSPDLVRSGDFDLGGMLAALGAKAAEMRARRIVFDALEVVLSLLPDAAARRREIHRLHEWLLAHGLTGLITLKSGDGEAGATGRDSYGFMQFMVDCAVILNHGVVLGVSQRNLRVQKYRGSGFDENESPFLIGESGIEVSTVAQAPDRGDVKATSERVSSGVESLDTMLGGGYFRGASVLVTGLPGTAKTTLSGAFAEAACRRGEHTLFVSFDSNCTEVIRNLASVGFRLDRYVRNGCLRMITARAISGSAETYLVRIKSLAKAHGARCLVIDPVSTWSKIGNDLSAQSVADRLIDWSKASGITLVCTSLLDETPGRADGATPLKISALADTWIHLDYLVQAGERNRGLSIIKSRGAAHSNQVRELFLSNAGVTLADTYTAGGEVLMGTLRREQERAERNANEASETAARVKHVRLDAEAAEIEVRLKSLRVELTAKQAERAALARSTQSRAGALSPGRARMRELRGADATLAPRK